MTWPSWYDELYRVCLLIFCIPFIMVVLLFLFLYYVVLGTIFDTIKAFR